MSDLLLSPNGARASASLRAPDAPVFIIGTAPATWQNLAHALWQHWTAAAAHAGGVVTDPAVDPLRLAAEHPGGRFIVCIESPAQALLQAWAGTSGSAADVDQVFARWSVRARQLLTLVLHHRDRCLCLTTDEAVSGPSALAAALTAWDPVLASLPAALPQPPAASAVHLALADAAMQSSVVTGTLHAELCATCVELGPGPASRPAVDAAAAELMALEAARAKAEASSLASAGRLAAVERELDSVRKQQRVSPEQQRELAEAREESDLLLQQLHQVQEELEQYYLQLKAREEQPAKNGGPQEVRARKVHFGTAVALAPHRHIDLEFSEVQSPSVRFGALPLRLVEHGGRPGLVLFGSEGRPGPLSSWAPHGSEGGQPFMLLVPADDEGRRCLDRMGTRDWQLVGGLARLMRDHLAAAGDRYAAWLAIAARLCEALAALPPRWRYDRLDCTPDAQTPGALQLDFRAALFGDRLLGDTRLRWQPAQGRLAWAAPADLTVVPVAAWPAGAVGRLVPEWPLPVGAGDAADKTRAWAALSPTEQQMLMGLLDALPSAADRQGGGATADPAQLRDRARALRREAQGTWLRLRVRQLLRRVLRRGPR